MQKPTVMPDAYYRLVSEVDDYIDEIKLNSSSLTGKQKETLYALSGKKQEQREDKFSPSEVDKQYQLVKKIRDQVVDNRGDILLAATVKDVSALISSINSLISLFLKAQQQIDAASEMADLKNAVIQAIGTLEPEQQARFYDSMSK